MWDAIKLLFRRKFIALNDDMKKEVNEMENITVYHIFKIFCK